MRAVSYIFQHPDGKIVAVAGRSAIYTWNTTTPEPHLIETFIGHTKQVGSLAFSSPSSLISVSVDQSVKFWKIGAQSTDLVETHPEFIPLAPVTIMSITLKAKDNISITSDSDGVVKTWDIYIGICKTPFQTPAKGTNKRDIQITNGSWFLFGMQMRRPRSGMLRKRNFSSQQMLLVTWRILRYQKMGPDSIP